MSRVANNPVELPSGVEVKLEGNDLTVKGSKGSLALSINEGIQVSHDDNVLSFTYGDDDSKAMAGTTRALVNNMVKGVSEGWEKKLVLNGVGYRANVSGKKVNLTLGLSHPVEYELPEGISAETPSQTEIDVKGNDKHAVGQVSAQLRSLRPPDPYTCTALRYSD